MNKMTVRDALMEISTTGVCHTDLHAADGDWPVKPTLPFIPGHEGAGIVAALGPGVKHLKEGDRVGIAAAWSSESARRLRDGLSRGPTGA